MVAILMMSAKLATTGSLIIKVLLNKVHEVLVSVDDVTNKFLSRDLNNTVDVII